MTKNNHAKAFVLNTSIAHLKIEGHKLIVSTGNETNLALSLSKKTWESEFFEKEIAEIMLRGSPGTDEAADSLKVCLGVLLDHEQAQIYDIIEANLDTRYIRIAPLLEEKGFRLVDSRIEFLTKIEKTSMDSKTNGDDKIRFAKASDKRGVLKLTHRFFTDNESFLSRYKISDYYHASDAKRYFETWIQNCFKYDDVLFAVCVTNDDVNGYFIYQKKGNLDGLAIYKGILTVVAPEFRGKNLHLKMQAFLYRHIPEKMFFLDNTTQLSNLPVIQNHIKSGKRLENISLTFYRKKC